VAIMSESKNKVVVWMQVSLDGRTRGPNGEFDWPVVKQCPRSRTAT